MGQQTQEQGVTLRMMRQDVNVLLRYFNGLSDLSGTNAITQAELDLAEGNRESLERAINTILGLKVMINQGDPKSTANEHIATLLGKAESYYVQSGYNISELDYDSQ